MAATELNKDAEEDIKDEGFAAIGNDKPVEELMQVLSNSKLEKLITEYCYG